MTNPSISNARELIPHLVLEWGGGQSKNVGLSEPESLPGWSRHNRGRDGPWLLQELEKSHEAERGVVVP